MKRNRGVGITTADETKQGWLDGIKSVKNLINEKKRLEGQLKYELDTMEAGIAQLKKGFNDVQGEVLDYATNLASAISDAVQDQSYEALIQVGIDTIKMIFDYANTKYKEDWLTKIIAIDYISESESQLAAMLDKKYL